MTKQQRARAAQAATQATVADTATTERAVQQGDTVTFCTGDGRWPAMVIQNREDELDLVVLHAPDSGLQCSTFYARVPRRRLDSQRGVVTWEPREV